MFFLEVNDQCVIIEIVLLALSVVLSITDETTFVCFSTVAIKLIAAIESFTTKATLGMSFETTLNGRTR